MVGIGAVPNTRLAAAAGLHVDNGITVDASLQTSDPDIHAAGDVAKAFHPMLGKHIRVEHWANTLHQPETAARSMLGQTASYDRVPYFFTDQYDLGMEYAGYTEPDGYDDVVVRGNLTTRQFIAFWTAQGRVLAGMNVDIWDVKETIQLWSPPAPGSTRPDWPTPTCHWRNSPPGDAPQQRVPWRGDASPARGNQRRADLGRGPPVTDTRPRWSPIFTPAGR